jgi:hypothetical protein
MSEISSGIECFFNSLHLKFLALFIQGRQLVGALDQ